MRILMISPQFRPLVGGYERAAERLSAALSARGHAVTIVAERRDPAWPASETSNGAQLRRLWCVYRPRLHVITSSLSLTGFLVFYGRRFDVWHVHQYGIQAALAIALGRVLRRPVVVKLTSSSYQGISQALSEGPLPRFTVWLHRRANAVVALSKETAAEAAAFGIPPARIHAVGNGVDTEIFRPRSESERRALKEKLGLGSASVVISVGRLGEAKNIEGLMKAWYLAVPRLPANWRLVVVGDGPLRDVAQELSREYLTADRVRFVGRQKNVDDWLGASEIYVSTAWREGLSNTLLEAMATGLPVVATRVSAVPEVVEATEAGMTVKLGDMEAVADAIVAMASNTALREAAGVRARDTILGKYAIEAVAAAQESVYALIRGRAGRDHFQE